ncbi:hypothetical protein BANRA_02498 [Klebsiella pneumoniae]|nr:hypothetical protein BANRA_02498 [Klebsiella pneumoniae]
MQWQIINGWYCVTACGLMSWKFRTLPEAISWAFVSKLAAKRKWVWGEQVNIQQINNLKNHEQHRRRLPA